MENRLSQDLDHVLDHTGDIWAEMRGERIFVTGGTGFVGSWLLESLLWANRRMSLGIRCSVLTRNPAAFRSGNARRAHLRYWRHGFCRKLASGEPALGQPPDESRHTVLRADAEPGRVRRAATPPGVR